MIFSKAATSHQYVPTAKHYAIKNTTLPEKPAPTPAGSFFTHPSLRLHADADAVQHPQPQAPEQRYNADTFELLRKAEHAPQTSQETIADSLAHKLLGTVSL